MNVFEILALRKRNFGPVSDNDPTASAETLVNLLLQDHYEKERVGILCEYTGIQIQTCY